MRSKEYIGTYHRGDRVRIRKWKDMAEEFGFGNEGEGYINCCGIHFTTMMKQLCGREYVITKCECDRHRRIMLDGEETRRWFITEYMIEPAEGQCEFDFEQLDEFLGTFMK